MTGLRFTCVLAAIACFTATPVAAQQYSFRVYGPDQGLTNLEIGSLYQDSKGFLWVSTGNGIFTYDGKRFQPFGENDGIPVAPSAAFGEALDGTLLVGGSFGLFRKVGPRFERLPLPGATSVSSSSGIRSDGKGTSWLATDAGLMAVTKAPGSRDFAFHLVPKPPGIDRPNVSSILVEENQVWYGCDRNLCRLHEGSVEVFGPADGLPLSDWKAMQRAGNGELWAQGAQLAVLRSGRNRWEVPEQPLFSGGVTQGLTEDSMGRIIVGSQEGLAIRENGSWRAVGRESGLQGSVRCILQDREGSVWIGLAGRGLARWQGYRQWESFGPESGLGSDVIYEILPSPGGRVWAATQSGLFRGEHRNGALSFRSQPQFAGITIHAVRADKSGALWLGTEQKGVAKFDPAAGTVEWFRQAQGLEARNAPGLTLDSRNRIWAATEAGLFVADLNAPRFRPVPQVSRLHVWTVVEAPNGDMWAGSDKGVFRLPAGNPVETGWIHMGAAEGLGHDVVLSIAPAKDGTVWLGYRHGGGLDRLRFDGAAPRVEHIAASPGERLPTVYFLGFDARERLWAGTDAGVQILERGTWSLYDRRDGLVWDDCDLGGFAAQPDGSVWIGTSGGLAHFTPQPTPLVYPPDVVFTGINLGGVDLGGIEKDPQVRPSVGHRANMLRVRFAALAFEHEGSLLFRYRMAPLFSEWRETRQRELQFDGIPPGAYRLEIQARDGWGHWSLDPAVFSFEVRQPWWQTGWFLLAATLATIGLAALIGRIRGAALRNRERELVRQVEERTAELSQANQRLLRMASLEHEKELVEKERAHALERAAVHRRAIETLALAIEAKDQTTGDHLQRVEVYALEVARELGLDEASQEALRAAALLHDIGKLAVPEYIISKPGRLTPAEFEKMKVHTVVGAEIVDLIRFPGPVGAIVRAHHEKWNGAGYPDGLSGEQIPIGARILAAVDCLDALASDRQYRRALPPDEAIAIVRSESGKSFDPAVVEVLTRRYPELELKARGAGSAERMKLSTDIKIVRGERPAAGFEANSSPASTRSDLVSLHDSLTQHDAGAHALENLKLSIENWEERAEIFALLRQSLCEVVPYDVMALYLRNGDRLIPEACDCGPYKAFVAVQIPMGTGLSGWVAENRKPSVNGNPAVEPGYLADPALFRSLRSALAVPLESQQQAIGVISLYRTGIDAFSPRDLRRLLSVASTIAEALNQSDELLKGSPVVVDR